MNSDAQLPSTYYRRASAKRLVLFAVLLANLLYSTLAFAQVLGTGQLNIERRSHTATLLENEKVLIVGGDNQNGMVTQAEIFDPIPKTSALAAALITPRTDHSATRLSDGRVLVIGGRDHTGSLQSTEVYNPLTTSFVAGPAMIRARAGHTATMLANDRILVVGGDLFGSAEIYDPVTQSFSLVTGSLKTPRKFHSAILVQNGQVMIVGGVNAQDNVLNTAEVFDPASQSFYLPPTDMQTARAFAMLKLLPDGKVQIIGGDGELSMEVFDPADGIFIAKALLPPNADLLGATLSTQSRAALFSPTISQDPLLQGILTAEQLSLLDRADQSITELPSRNEALVAGGLNSTGQVLNSAKLVSSSRASVTTDKTDYAPGQIVTITGSGFQANEQVAIYFHEFPEEYPDVFLSAVTNQQGNFVIAEFAPQEIDLGRIFTVTAIGQSSAFAAQTAFKDARNWNLSFAGTGSGSVTISPSTGTINAPNLCGGTGTNATSQTVTSTCLPNITTSDNNATVTFSANASSGSTFAGWSAPSGLSTSTCLGTTNPCSAVFGGGAELTVTFNAVTATSLTVSPASGTYGGTVNLSATLTRASNGTAVSGKTITFTLNGNSVGSATTNASGLATLSNVSLAGLNASTYIGGVNSGVGASFAGDSTFSSSSGVATLIINKLTIVVTPTASQFKTYSSSDPTLAYGFAPALIGSDTFTGALARDSGENVGFYNITQGTLALSSNYTLNFTSGVQFEIKKLTIVVTPTANQNKTYGSSDPTLAYGFAPALIGSDTFTGSLARDSGENVGFYNITQGTLALSSNYTLNFTSGVQFEIKKLTIVVTPNAGQNKTYGSSDPTLTYGFAPALIGTDSFSGVLSRDAGSDVGFYNITQGTLALSSNYTLNFTSGVQFEIKNLTIVVTSTANQNKTYGSSDPTLTYGFAPALISGDSFSGALARDPGENVGFYNITQGTLALSSNYTLNFTSGVQFEIKNLTIVVTPTANQNKTYGSSDPTLTYGFAPALIGSDTFSGALARDPGENVGRNITQGTVALSSNYTLSFTSGVQFEIKKLTIVVTPTANQNKTYGSADPTVAYGFAPALIGSDTFSGAPARDPGENVGFYNITQGTLALSSNYTLNFTSGVQFEIKKLTIVVTPTANQNKTYGSSDPTLTYGFAPSLIGTDSFSGVLSRDAGSDVGLYNITQGTLALSSNYTLNFTSGVQFEIKKLTIVVTPTANQNKTYGSSDPTLAYGFAPALIGSDTFTGSLARDSGENVGFYNITQGTLALSSNYTLNFTSGVQFEIKKLTIVVTPNAGQNKTYGSSDPTLTYGFAPALISGDSFSGELARDPGTNVGFYNITQGTLALSSNYTLSFTSGVQFEIKKLTIVVIPTANQNKTYGSADPTVAYGFAPALIGSDTFSGAPARDPGENVGFYNITQGTLALSSNYTLNFTSGVQFEIKKRPITVTADAKTKTYGESDPPLTYQVISGSLAFTDAFTGALSRVTGELVGTYAIQQNTFSINNIGNYNLTFVGSQLTITTGFAFNGFYSPIGGSVENGNGGNYADPLKTFKLGSTIPVKFGATWLNGGAALITGIHTLQAVKYNNATDSAPPIDATPTDAATDGNQFRLTTTDWHFNLSTKANGFSAGTWLLIATLQDGSKHSVWISIKK